MSGPPPVLTIDGPSGVGKGAVSAQVAAALGWRVLDSGAVYRAVGLAALEQGVDETDRDGLIALSRRLPLSFRPGADGIEVLLDGRPVGETLRSDPGRAAGPAAGLPPAAGAGRRRARHGDRGLSGCAGQGVPRSQRRGTGTET